MKKDYLKNEHIRLRAIEPEDVEVMYQMENDPAFWEVSSFSVPYSRFVLSEYINHSSNDIYTDKQLRLMIVSQSDNQVVGTIDICDYVPQHGRGAIGIGILPHYRRKGYARDAVNLVLEYAFQFLHFQQLYAMIPVDNTASIQLFESCGFKEAGLLKEWLRGAAGQGYKDVMVVQCFGYPSNSPIALL